MDQWLKDDMAKYAAEWTALAKHYRQIAAAFAVFIRDDMLPVLEPHLPEGYSFDPARCSLEFYDGPNDDQAPSSRFYVRLYLLRGGKPFPDLAAPKIPTFEHDSEVLKALAEEYGVSQILIGGEDTIIG